MDDLPFVDDSEERAHRWASSMAGHADDEIVVAHADSRATVGEAEIMTREAREERDALMLASNATQASGAGSRAVEETADPFRTCFERDRDRILHDSAFRRLAGKNPGFRVPWRSST